jgi:hypothetical protein
MGLALVSFTAGPVVRSQSTVKPKEAQSDTRINETSFRLTLPGIWTSAPSSDPTLRTYRTNTEQLTISIFGSPFGAAGAMDHDAKVARFKRLVGKMRIVDARAAEPAVVTLEEPLFGESGGTLAARYTGYDAAHQRRVHCLLLASSSAFETFYYEAVGLSEQAAVDRAKAIFNSVDIPK